MRGTEIKILFGGRPTTAIVLSVREAQGDILCEVRNNDGAMMGVFPVFAEDIVETPATRAVAAINARNGADAGISLVEDADHWAGYGILTVAQLDAYFEAESEKALRKTR
jgi:hypothetical protein